MKLVAKTKHDDIESSCTVDHSELIGFIGIDSICLKAIENSWPYVPYSPQETSRGMIYRGYQIKIFVLKYTIMILARVWKWGKPLHWNYTS